VLATINEPTAAALAAFPSPCLPDGQSRVVVIYDFGGGTFDVSVIRISKMSEAGGFRYRVLSTEGDAYLGGIDIDKEIVSYFLKMCQCVLFPT
jgi:molecular chaperone DnaK (HSP70)